MWSSRNLPTCRRATSALIRKVPTSPITTVTERPTVSTLSAVRTPAVVLDGKAVAAKVRGEVAARARLFKNEFGRAPGLAVVQVGEDPASTVYVRNKRRSCEEVAIASFAHDLAAATREAELLELITKLNGDASVDGILVQMPLPKGLDSNRIIDA